METHSRCQDREGSGIFALRNYHFGERVPNVSDSISTTRRSGRRRSAARGPRIAAGVIASLVLALTASAPASATSGATATFAPVGTGSYMLTVTNLGPETITGFIVGTGTEPAANFAPSRVCRFLALPDAGQIWCTVTVAPGTSAQMCYTGRPPTELVILLAGGAREALASVGSSPALAACPLSGFNVESGSSGGAKRCVVPHLRGKTLAAAKRAILRARCSVGRVKKAHSSHVKKGRVISQSLAAGKSRPKGTKVSLVVSEGK
jgi:hypothetical protein